MLKNDKQAICVLSFLQDKIHMTTKISTMGE